MTCAPATLVVLILTCALAPGCSTGVQKPSASVTAMTLGEVDAHGFTMNFGVNVNNPNAIALPLAGTDYKLGIGGVGVLGGKTKSKGSIPAKGSRDVTVPVTVAFDNLLAAEQAIRDSGGDVPYDLSGGLSFDTGNPLLGSLRVPLRYSGTLPLKRVLSDPEALLRSDAARKLAGEIMGRFFGK